MPELKPLFVRIPKSTHYRLMKFCSSRDVPIQEGVRLAIDNYMDLNDVQAELSSLSSEPGEHSAGETEGLGSVRGRAIVEDGRV